VSRLGNAPSDAPLPRFVLRHKREEEDFDPRWRVIAKESGRVGGVLGGNWRFQIRRRGDVVSTTAYDAFGRPVRAPRPLGEILEITVRFRVLQAEASEATVRILPESRIVVHNPRTSKEDHGAGASPTATGGSAQEGEQDRSTEIAHAPRKATKAVELRLPTGKLIEFELEGQGANDSCMVRYMGLAGSSLPRDLQRPGFHLAFVRRATETERKQGFGETVVGKIGAVVGVTWTSSPQRREELYRTKNFNRSRTHVEVVRLPQGILEIAIRLRVLSASETETLVSVLPESGVIAKS
jgi:hypothetical protein